MSLADRFAAHFPIHHAGAVVELLAIDESSDYAALTVLA